MEPKTISQFIMGTFGGFIVGIVGFLALATYGGDYGCFVWARGYETCGVLGALAGVFIGSIVGVFSLSKTNFQKSTYKKLSIITCIATVIIPLAIGMILLRPTNLSPDLLALLQVIFVFIMISGISSLLITMIIYWISRKK